MNGPRVEEAWRQGRDPREGSQDSFPPTVSPHENGPVLTVCVGTQVSRGSEALAAGLCSPDGALLARAPGAVQSCTL